MCHSNPDADLSAGPWAGGVGGAHSLLPAAPRGDAAPTSGPPDPISTPNDLTGRCDIPNLALGTLASPL